MWLLCRVGKGYSADPSLPTGLIFSVLGARTVWLLRGLVRRRSIVFIASRVRIRGAKHVTLGRNSTLERDVVIDGYSRNGVLIGSRSRIGAFTVISCTSHLSRLGEGFYLGADSGIGEFGYIGASGGVKVGRNVIMGQYVSFHSQEHHFDSVATPIRLQGSSQRGIQIDDNCWIGARVTFLDGSKVGTGSVVAAGAVVKGVFPANSLIGGVPARVIRPRTG